MNTNLIRSPGVVSFDWVRDYMWVSDWVGGWVGGWTKAVSEENLREREFQSR